MAHYIVHCVCNIMVKENETKRSREFQVLLCDVVLLCVFYYLFVCLFFLNSKEKFLWRQYKHAYENIL